MSMPMDDCPKLTRRQAHSSISVFGEHFCHSANAHLQVGWRGHHVKNKPWMSAKGREGQRTWEENLDRVRVEWLASGIPDVSLSLLLSFSRPRLAFNIPTFSRARMRAPDPLSAKSLLCRSAFFLLVHTCTHCSPSIP